MVVDEQVRVVADAAPHPNSAYDELVERSPQGSVFCTSWWLDAVAPGRWRSHLVEENDRAVAAWPTIVKETPFGTVHAGAPLTPFLGPLFPRDESAHRRSREEKYAELLLEQLESFAHLEARCNPAFDYWTPLSWHGFKQTTHYTWRLPDLSQLGPIWEGLRENVRREIRKARKTGVVVEEGYVDDFLALHERGTAVRSAPEAAERNRELIRRITAAARRHDAASILLARGADGRLHSGALFVHDSQFTYYLVGASEPELRTSGAASLVMWEGIERASVRGTGFDFEGSMLRQVERFVRSFGGVPAPYSIVKKTPSALYGASVAVKRRLAGRIRARG